MHITFDILTWQIYITYIPGGGGDGDGGVCGGG